MTDLYRRFQTENTDVSIGQRSFELLRPRDVGFAKESHRLICCCTQHTNLQFALDNLNQISVNGGGSHLFKNTHEFVDSTLCGDGRGIDCLHRRCDECGTAVPFVFMTGLRCRRGCREANCSKCPVTWRSYQRVTRDGKSVMALEETTDSLDSFVLYVQEKLSSFAYHRFMASHMHQQYRNAVNNIKNSEIIVINDFAENYSMILPNEIQSCYWVNVQSTIYVSVVTRHGQHSSPEEPVLVDEHYIFLSNDLDHDAHFAEHCKNLLIRDLARRGHKLKRVLEFCDGAASQFKSSTAFAYLASGEIPTIRYFWETSHGKHKADGAGGVVKNAAKMAVVRKNALIRSALELYRFCDEHLKIENEERRTVVREFYYIQKGDVKRNVIGSWKTVKGTRGFHEVHGNDSQAQNLLVRDIGCACEGCLSFKGCEDIIIPPLTSKLIEPASGVPPVDADEVVEACLDSTRAAPISGTIVAVMNDADDLEPYNLFCVMKTEEYTVWGNRLIKSESDDDEYHESTETSLLAAPILPFCIAVQERGTDDYGRESYTISSETHDRIMSFSL